MPLFIQTTKGVKDITTLRVVPVINERPNGVSSWVQYWDDTQTPPELVRQDVAFRPYSIEEQVARTQAINAEKDNKP